MRRAILSRLLLLIISLGFSALVGEVTLRLLGHRGVPILDISERIRPVDDPVVDYRYKPGSEYWTGNVVYRFNDAGFRDIKHEPVPEPGVVRVAIIGDSVTVGYGVMEDEIFSAQARALVGRDFELINVAMSGLNAPQAVHLLENEGLLYQPGIVVMNFVLNDCDFSTRYEESRKYREQADAKINLLGISVDPRIKRALKSSALIYFLSQRADRWLGKEDLEHADYILRIWDKRSNREKVLNAFDRLAELREDYGFDLVVLIWPAIVEFRHYVYSDIHDWVAEQASAREIDVIDLQPLFAAGGDHSSYLLEPGDYIHPNAMGHEVGARALADWLHQR